jgi:hypothetical protein
MFLRAFESQGWVLITIITSFEHGMCSIISLVMPPETDYRLEPLQDNYTPDTLDYNSATWHTSRNEHIHVAILIFLLNSD